LCRPPGLNLAREARALEYSASNCEKMLLIFTSIIPVLSFPSIRYGAVSLGGFFSKVTHRAPVRPIPILGLYSSTMRYYVLVFPFCTRMIGCYFHIGSESGGKKENAEEKRREKKVRNPGELH